MGLLQVITDFALLPCCLLTSIYHCYYGETQDALTYLIAWVVVYYFQQVKQGNLLVVYKIQQFQIDQAQRRIKSVVSEVSSLAEQFNEATKLRTDIQVKQTLLSKQLFLIDDNLKQLQREYTSLDTSVKKLQNTVLLFN